MREFLDGDDLYTDLMMMYQVNKRITILVEGIEDVAIIDPFLNETACRSEVGHGKANVLRAAQIAQQNGMGHVFAAVDRDFDDIGTIRSYSEKISVSEHYDLHADALLACSDLMDRILAAHADRQKLDDYINRCGKSVSSVVTVIAGHVGALRYASVRQELCLSLADFPTAKLIPPYEKGTLIEEIARIAAAKSADSNLTHEDIAGVLEAAAAEVRLEAVCSGHDVVNVTSALTRLRLGGKTGADAMGRAFRSAVGWDCFQRLQICSDLRTWGDERGSKVWIRDVAA